eukprot:s2174_g5.t1
MFWRTGMEAPERQDGRRWSDPRLSQVPSPYAPSRLVPLDQLGAAPVPLTPQVYCSQCAYTNGFCAMCGKKMVDVSNHIMSTT